MNCAKFLQYVGNMIMVATSIALMYLGVLTYDLETEKLVKVGGFLKVNAIMSIIVGPFIGNAYMQRFFHSSYFGKKATELHSYVHT